VADSRAWETPQDDAVALRTSYALCRRIHRKGNRTTFLATRLLTAPTTRLHADALNAYFFATDRLADESSSEDRERAFALWSSDVLADLRRGRSDHPLRRALVHTARTHDLDPALFDDFQAATIADATRVADFETFADLRAFMRGVSGTCAVLSVRVLGPAHADSDHVASLMGEVHQFLDIFEDFPIDLAQQRLYLPLEDLAKCGVSRADVLEYAAGTTPAASANLDALDALDALIHLQADRARAMLREAKSLLATLPHASRPIIAGSLDIQAAQLDIIERSGARVLREGTKMPRVRVLRLAWPHLRAARRSW
jgi:phytoene synthase